MSSPIVLSVNGRNGLDVSHVNQSEQSWDIIRSVSTTIHGSNGANALEPIRGEPAGTLYVELLQSQNRPEGFAIKALGQVPENRIAPVTEILPHRDVILEAIGGDGEPGRRGANGQSGRDGRPGIDATRVQDATSGTDGGNGGDAGSGTNGANGGNGGNIRIYVDADNTHLLLATRWDVRGEKVGLPDSTASQDQEEKGAKGARNLLGMSKMATNIDVLQTVQAGRLHRPRILALVSGIGSQVSAGSSLQTAVVRLAAYRANTLRDTTGLCECSGGNGHCTGCDAIPVYQKKARLPGADGLDGQRGASPISPLFPGQDGRNGTGLIIVTSRSGPEQTFRSCYQLELVDFDVEDENEDGIFEPGEHLFIRRIRVRNTGGMPSPTRQTRLEIAPSEDLQPVVGSEGRALIPPVMVGQIVTLPGSIKVKIREPGRPSLGCSSFKKASVIELKATMPGLNRRMKHFDYSKTIEIQYPLELQHPNFLRTMAQGSQNKIYLKIKNKGNKTFGTERSFQRRAEIQISIPTETGSLFASQSTWASQVTRESGSIEPGEIVDFMQTARISHRAKDHAYAEIHIEFYISNPTQLPTTRQSLGPGQRLTQSFDLKIQIAATHIFDEDAGVLVVTNEKTPADQFEAIGNFIRKDLQLKMNIWNVSLYGGMIPHDEKTSELEEDRTNILEEYRGRTIIFLGNKFDHFNLKEQTILELCERQVAANECFSGSSFLVLGTAAAKARRDSWLKSVVFPLSHPVSDVPKLVSESSTFDNKTALVRSICEQITAGTIAPRVYQVDSIPRWYYGGARMTVRRQAKQVQNYLRANLPQERFLICPVSSQIGQSTAPAYVAVWHGLPSRGIMFATESKPLLKRRGRSPRLHPFDAFNIVCSLPYLLRIRLLCLFDTDGDASSERTDEDETLGSVTPSDSAGYSDHILDSVQYSLEEAVSTEIEKYVCQGPLMDNIVLGGEHDPCRIHLPCLETILQHIEDSENVSERALEVVRTAMVATNPQSKTQIARSLAIPFGQRRAQLKAYLNRRVDDLLRTKGYSDEGLKAFRTRVKGTHSRFNAKKRNVVNTIKERNRKFTNLSMHEYQKGRYTTQSLVSRTEFCTEEEWDRRYQDIQRAHKTLERNMKSARDLMSSMRLDIIPEN